MTPCVGKETVRRNPYYNVFVVRVVGSRVVLPARERNSLGLRMSITVTNGQGESHTYGGHFWGGILNFAEHYGWKPAGTARPKGFGILRRWPGNYDSNDGQTVTTSDAKSLGRAILQSMNDPILDENIEILETSIRKDVLSRVGPELFASFAFRFDKNAYREFGEFCLRGPFRIE